MQAKFGRTVGLGMATGWMFVSPPRGHSESRPQGDGVRRLGPWEVMGSSGWSLRNGASAQIGGTPASCLPALPCEDAVRRWPSVRPEEGPRRTPKPLGLGLPASRTVNEKRPLFTSPRLWDFVTVARTDLGGGGTGSHRRPGAWHEGPCALQASVGSGGCHFCPVPAGSAQGCPELVTGAGSGACPLSAGLCVWCVPASCGRCNKVPQTGRLTRHDDLPVWCQKSEIEEPAGPARPGGPEGAPSGFCGSGGPSARGHVPLARASGERRRLTHVLGMAA